MNQQLEETLIDEFFANLKRQAETNQPLPIEAPQVRPHYQKPQHLIEREQIEDQIRNLVDASTARVYEMLKQRLDEMIARQEAIKAQNAEIIRLQAERKTASGLCTPSRCDWY